MLMVTGVARAMHLAQSSAQRFDLPLIKVFLALESFEHL
jgi:hypothetical protein